jgi:hypothetical protein
MSHFYEIVVEDHLGPSWEEWFDGMEFEQKLTLDGQRGITVISGALKDQAALFGVLIKIRDLGLILISVNRIQQK